MHSLLVTKSWSRLGFSFLLMWGILTAVGGSAWAQGQTEADGAAKSPKWGLSFGGYGMGGRVTTALLPTSGDDYGDMNTIERPYGFGLSIDYKVSPSMRLFLDGNVSTYRKQVAVKDEYSTSFWVYEMTGYESQTVGPFTDDAYFYMDTTGMRVGLKYDFAARGYRPWVGAGLGLYSWKAEYATVDRTGTWGSDTGTATGATFLAGVDFFVGKASMITLFGDFTSPVAYPVIENLFNPGWTWDNVGGNHVTGPYRFGVSFGFLR